MRAVALYNPSEQPCSFTVPLTDLEFEGTVKVRDLVKHRDLGKVDGALKQEVPAHGAMILRIEGKKRIEPRVYEAEWAYLPLFDDLGKIRMQSDILRKKVLPGNDRRVFGGTTGKLCRMERDI